MAWLCACVLLHVSACRGPEHPGFWTQTGLPWSVDQAQGLLPQGARVHTGAPVVPSVSGECHSVPPQTVVEPSQQRDGGFWWATSREETTSCFDVNWKWSKAKFQNDDHLVCVHQPSLSASENVKLHNLTCHRLTFLQTLEQEEKDNEAVSKMMALDQKNQLLNLFHEKNRPTLAKWPPVGF